MKSLFVKLILFFSITSITQSTLAIDKPVYICTAANSTSFTCLLNFIGSLHKYNFNDINHIAIYNLGLSNEEINYLKTIEKLEVYSIELTHPDLLKSFNTKSSEESIQGWYAWKPVAIKQTFDSAPANSIVLWVDAGTTILNTILPLLNYIREQGYFFHNSAAKAITKQITTFVKKSINIHPHDYRWILYGETTYGLEAGLMGLTKKSYMDVVYPAYVLSADLRFFADDGTCPEGFGQCRYDQSLYSIYALLNNYKILHHYEKPDDIFYLHSKNQAYPFHIAYNSGTRRPETTIYCSGLDIKPEEFLGYIHKKESI